MQVRNVAGVLAAMPAKLRRAVILLIACLASGAAALVAPVVASGASLPTACSGDVCFKQYAYYGTFYAWAQSYNFYGHFQLQTPEHTSLNSPEQEWITGGHGYQFSPRESGKYCITAWQLQGTSGYNKIGYTCLNSKIT